MKPKEKIQWAIGWVNCDNCGNNVPCAKRWKWGAKNKVVHIRPPLCPHCGAGYQLRIRPEFYAARYITPPDGTLAVFLEERLGEEKR
jgi:hypothetical protein